MKVYTYTKTREKLAEILDQAAFGEEIRIKRKDGQMFQLLLVVEPRSPLDVRPVLSHMTREEIVSSIHEGRRESVS